MSAIQGIYKYQHGGDVLLRRGLTVRVARESGLVRAGGDGTRNTEMKTKGICTLSICT